MGTEAMILTGLALLFGLYMAWNIGANDVANAMGTSVGSGALTLKRAVILAAVMEFAGAFFIGPHVTETVRKGIIDISMFSGEEGARMLCFGMLAALLAAGAWLQIASYFGWPVSTTHSIVGAIVGFGCVYGGIHTVDWFGGNGFNVVTILSGKGGVASIVASWVVSPLISGVIAYFVFRFILRKIFYRPDPVVAARKWTPILVFAVLVTMMLVLSLKGLKPFWHDNFGLKPTDKWPLTIGLGASILSGIVGALVSRKLVVKVKDDDPALARLQADLYTARAMSKALMHLRRVHSTAIDEQARAQAQRALEESEKLYKEVRDRTRGNTDSHIYHNVERIFIYLQIISAAFVALAHGSNDVANAIGPLSVVVETAKTMSIPEKTSVPLWVLGVGGVGIVVGLAAWGWRVMQTVGKRITELTPSRGFCAEFAAAITILIASVYKLPISTTHTLVGAVLGVGLARGIGALNLNTIRDIVASWIITIPAGAGLAILFFYGLQLIFG